MLGPRAAAELASITDLLETRALIEVQVAELACQRRTFAQAEEILELASQLTSWEANLAFHCAIASATQNLCWNVSSRAGRARRGAAPARTLRGP